MQILLSALIAASIVFVVEMFRGAPFVSRILNFVPADLYLLASIPALYAAINVLIQFAQRKRVSRGRWTFFVTSATVSAFAAAASFVYALSISGSLVNGSHTIIYAGLFAAFFATVGWIVTNYLNFVNARKSHTMATLMQMRTSSVFQDHMFNIYKHFDLNVPISKETAEAIRNEAAEFYKKQDKNEHPVHKSLIYIANYYEFMCLGINSGDLDRKMMKRSMHGIIRNFYKFNKNVIDLARQDDYGAPNDKVFCEIKVVAKEYGLDI